MFLVFCHFLTYVLLIFYLHPISNCNNNNNNNNNDNNNHTSHHDCDQHTNNSKQSKNKRVCVCLSLCFCVLVCLCVPSVCCPGQDKQLRGAGQSPQLLAHARPLPVDVPVWNQPGAAECVSETEPPHSPALLPGGLQPVQVLRIQTCTL